MMRNGKTRASFVTPWTPVHTKSFRCSIFPGRSSRTFVVLEICRGWTWMYKVPALTICQLAICIRCLNSTSWVQLSPIRNFKSKTTKSSSKSFKCKSSKLLTSQTGFVSKFLPQNASSLLFKILLNLARFVIAKMRAKIALKLTLQMKQMWNRKKKQSSQMYYSTSPRTSG